MSGRKSEYWHRSNNVGHGEQGAELGWFWDSVPVQLWTTYKWLKQPPRT